MTVARALELVLAGIGAGLSGSVAGLASLVSYPALLAIGLSPITANVTNTVALVASSTGSITGSRVELRGRAAHVRPLAIAGLLGGAAGGVLLLVTPSSAFQRAVPVLLAIASLGIILRRRLVDEHQVERATATRPSRGLLAGIALVGVYGGYFGAGAGVMLLALLLLASGDTLPRCTAVKNVVLGVANGVAAIVFAFVGHVRWSVVPPLAIGMFCGARLGPMIVRRAPPTPLRVAIAIAGLGLAVKLGFDAYT